MAQVQNGDYSVNGGDKFDVLLDSDLNQSWSKRKSIEQVADDFKQCVVSKDMNKMNANKEFYNKLKTYMMIKNDP